MMIDGVVPYFAKNHSLTVFSISDPELLDREKVDNVEYIRFPRKNYRLMVAEELKNHHFDIIHVFNRPKNVNLYKMSSPNSKIVLSLHNDMFSEKKISRIDGEEAIEQAAQITAVSDYIKTTVVNRFPLAERKINVLYSGVDLDRFKPVWTEDGERKRRQLRDKYGIQDKKVILFVGRLSKTKGPHILIKAMEEIVGKHNDAVLVIVGGKWFSDNRINGYVNMLYELAQPFKDQIIFTKYIPSSDIPDMFLMADVFICSSQWNEPLARVHYEAMAAGIPVITTDRGGNAEVVIHGFNGLLINNYKNPKHFAQAVDYIFSNQDHAKLMAQTGRKLIELNFCFQHVYERLEKVYDRALNKE
ncbi:spore coat protein [Bacillus methanolicus PB1]|uniref:Spore coat protein n=1 Tax=Bacillus methanolicus PB1 TaxID=997296 RepID=I3E5H6_BACMT|nr:glycosyltransferase family 4 protein [Bacillus methanolicus]EIJ81747.1 spore coat protein [Bacillus methanolicus PB1]